ncbi:MAG: gliding motility protein GldN [Bacteroidales bacterium]|jgi:gliding motility associated protien GldN|nr:gliding motility protein GldN [Bacteroidales bacterium]MDD3700779.1 gliding motility protein GldN [Bacteroidales bacterium]MDY0370388.1 gliding motility protein GldN [Bacteroidales bacterium]
MKNILLKLFAVLMFLSYVKEPAAQILNESPVDGLFANTGRMEREPIPLPSIREGDVMWSKRIWREIDFRQKINQPFYYPIDSHNNLRSFINVLMDGLKERKFRAYDLSNTDELLVPITYNEIVSRLTDTTIVRERRPYPPYEEYDTVIVRQFDPTRVMRLRLKEDWYFDKQRSQLMVRIIAVCPVMMVEKDGQEFSQPLFWVSYDQARKEFANAEVFNRFNSAERRTYDEIFIKRMFDSYIYKEENVYDRRINQYATGMDALLESERIKMDILNFMLDLWEY